jgi:SAM-dependent methyltransferase
MTNVEYVLGTHDEEVERLGIQHRVWRARALAGWQRAGFRSGQTILDVGCGPGWATRDLAELVGPAGKVLAIDRSRRFLDVVERERVARGLTQIETLEIDLNAIADQSRGADSRGLLNGIQADGAWCRWVLAFVREPRKLLRCIASALKPGGTLVIHEYFDYSTWKVSPGSAEFDAFVRTVMKAWRDDGGEPNIALDLVRWLKDAGLELRALTPMIDVISPASPICAWPKTFVEVGTRRLTDMSWMSGGQSAAVREALAKWEASADGLMLTPGLLEIVAEKSVRGDT